MRSKLLISALALGATALAAGCVAHAETTGVAEADAPVAFSEEPTLVAVEPNVWVVRDYDDSVYYVDDYYWVYRGNVWHRSRSYDRGWTTVEVTVVPRTIVTRDHRAYVHYHGEATAQIRKAPREHVASAPEDVKRHEGPEHADDHHDGPPGHDDHPADNARHDDNPRHDEAQHDDRQDNVHRDDNDKKEEPKRDDKKKGDKKDKRKGDKK